MKRMSWPHTMVAIIITFTTSIAFACTGLQIKTKGNQYVNGRTVEFGVSLDLGGLIVPHNYAFTGTLPNGKPGLSYRAKYAVVGANAYGAPAVIDGVNEKGLTAAAFYFPGYATYTEPTAGNEKRALSPTEFVNWLLTQFATLDEVKQGVSNIVLVPSAPKQWGGAPPFHYIVYDKQGKSLVIEPLDGKLVVSDDPIGVITNSPTIDWQLTNLSNYMNLTAMNIPTRQIDGYKLSQLGQGSGLHGLPGDFSPPSRFVRAAIFSASALPKKTIDQAAYELFHILNQFDLPPGAVRSDKNNKLEVDTTIATTVKDPNGLKYYFRTYDDQSIKMIALKAYDLDSKQLATVSMKSTQPVVDVSAKASG